MKRISTRNLVPGMVTAEDVFTYNNQLILAKGLVLTDKAITKLEFYSVLSIRVEDEVVEVADEETEAATISYSQQIQKSPEFIEYKNNFENTVATFKGSLDSFLNGDMALDPEEMLTETLDLVTSAGKRVNIFSMIHNMRTYDDLTYSHSVNVALVCHVIAEWMHLSPEDVKIATLCGLLHDVGKIQIPIEIIKKPSKLTEQEFAIIKTHTVKGYNILKNCNIDDRVKTAALMHHERYDGTGYPLGLHGEKLNVFSQIVAVADVYEAMTSARIYRGPWCPFNVLDLFIQEGMQKYNAQILIPFMNNIASTYMGYRVKLNNNMEGEIVYINPENITRPMIRCGEQFIDMSQDRSLQIVAIK